MYERTRLVCPARPGRKPDTFLRFLTCWHLEIVDDGGLAGTWWVGSTCHQVGVPLDDPSALYGPAAFGQT